MPGRSRGRSARELEPAVAALGIAWFVAVGLVAVALGWVLAAVVVALRTLVD